MVFLAVILEHARSPGVSGFFQLKKGTGCFAIPTGFVVFAVVGSICRGWNDKVAGMRCLQGHHC